jgi:hypothetical protein
VQVLGQLIWWTIGTPTLPAEQVKALIAEVGMEVPPPNPIVPVDAFRRMTGAARMEYNLDEALIVTLDLHKAKSQSTMLARHIVRTVRDQDGIVKDIKKVGDCAFYKPPRGQAERARIRVTVFPEGFEDRAQIEAFGESLRTGYNTALTHFDPQALRRVVRQYLTRVHALHLSGPYFMPSTPAAERLQEFVGHLGGGSNCWIAPLVDDLPRRVMLRETIEAAAVDGETSPALIDAYSELGLVTERAREALTPKE